MKARERIILALDVPYPLRAMEIVEKFCSHVDMFKVGLELFTSAGPEIVNEIHALGRKVFLDLKFHDIPNTVSKAGIAAARLGVFMFNMHAAGGYDMMKKCSDEVGEFCDREGLVKPKILGVTVLTSFSEEMLRDEVRVAGGIPSQVEHLAVLAKKAGLDGVVASAREVEEIRRKCGPGFLIVAPGIRVPGSSSDDQVRTVTPVEAVKVGADYLVMGRTVLNADDPIGTLGRIFAGIAEI